MSANDRVEPKSAPKAVGLAILFAVVVIVGVFGIIRFVDNERDRILLEWQTRLGIVADTRTALISGWVNQHHQELKKIAGNSSVQPYMQELMTPGSSDGKLAQGEYLRIFLTVAADRAGFVSELKGPDVPANVTRTGSSGIALLGPDGTPLVSTRAMPPIEGRLKAFIATLSPGKPAMLDIHAGANGKPVIAFAEPVMTGRSGRSETQIGWVFGVKEVAEELYPLMRQPGNVWPSAEGLLVRRVDNRIEYLSPRAQSEDETSQTVDFNTPGLAASFALKEPGGFGIYRDYSGDQVLVTGRLIEGTPWAYLYKVDRSQALGESDARLTRLLVLFLLVIALIAISVILIWRHASTRRTERALEENRKLVEELDARNLLLKQVTDAQQSPLFIVDDEGTYRFANRAAANDVGMPADSMPGRTMRNVIGPDATARVMANVLSATTFAEPVTHLDEQGEAAAKEVTKTEYIPLENKFDGHSGVLVFQEDLSELVSARDRQERVVAGVLRLLIGIVDRRDPSAAEHSSRVAAVAREIAEEMTLEESQVQSVEMAGLLMNFGKALVPRRLLTKAGKLSDDELEQVRESTARFTGLLEGLEFEGPVVEILRKVTGNDNKTDGATEDSDEAVRTPAQILGVANAFVAMISKRSWREGMDIDSAVAEIASQAGSRYERRVTAALLNLIENRDARSRWKAFADA